MYYLRARYYDPKIKRFIKKDPAEDGYNWYVYCGNNPVKYVDPSGEAVVIAGVVLTGEFIALIGTGIVVLGYLASKAFINAFTNEINSGETLRDSILYAKGKAKKTPSKLKNGDKIKTPDSHPNEFKKKKDGSYEHKKTGWKFKKDRAGHGGEHWDASPDGTYNNYINVYPDGYVR